MKPAAQLLKEGLTWQQLTDMGFVIAGSPATVIDRIKDFSDKLRVGNVMLLLHIGSMPHYLTMKNLQLFAEEVLPQVQPIFGEWDASHYWPSGFAEDRPAEATEPERQPERVPARA